ncbi:hypothetical protein G6F37_012260 [Rhizopus arrhizus]|nr:hypothetical protein G6F37_012260 [Rhizopus arrhizus]
MSFNWQIIQALMNARKFPIEIILVTNPSSSTSRFSQTLMPGENACCPYTTSDCVRSNGRNDLVKFSMFVLVNGMASTHFTMTLPGGGWLDLNGDKLGDLQYQAYYADGSPYETLYVKEESY